MKNMRADGVPELHIKKHVGSIMETTEKKRLASLTPSQLAGESGINYSKGFIPYTPVKAVPKSEMSPLIQKIFVKNKKGGYYHDPGDKSFFTQGTRKIGTKQQELDRLETKSIDVDLIAEAIQDNPLFKGATVDKTGMIILSNGKKFNAKNIDDVREFEAYMAERSKDDNAVRKDIALGNLSIKEGIVRHGTQAFLKEEDRAEIKYAPFNNDPRMVKLGYNITGGANGSQRLTKDGKLIDMNEFAYYIPELQQNFEDGAMPSDLQSTNPNAPNYFNIDSSLIQKYIYDNLDESELEDLEAMNGEAAQRFRNRRNKVIKESGTYYSAAQVDKSYRESREYADRFQSDAATFNISEAGIKKLMPLVAGEASNVGSSQGKEFEFTDEMATLFSPEDSIQIKKLLAKRGYEKTYAAGRKNYKQGMMDSFVSSSMTQYLDDEVAANMRGVYAAGIEGQVEYNDDGTLKMVETIGPDGKPVKVVAGFGELQVEKTAEKLEIDINNLEKGATETTREIRSMVNSIARQGAEDGISLDYVNNMYVAVGGSELERKPILDRLSILNNKQLDATKEYEKVKSSLLAEHAKHVFDREGTIQASDLVNRKYGNLNLLTTKFEDRVSQMALSIPALAGSTWSVEKKAEIGKRQQETLRLVPDYKMAVATGQKWEYMLANAGDQAPNMLAAIGLTVATGGSALASPIFFGLDSAASTWVDSDVATKGAAEAKIRLAALEKNRDNMNYNDYRDAKVALEKQIMMGDLSIEQRYGQAFSAGAIEFGVQYGLSVLGGLGTSGWARKFVGGSSKSVGNQIVNPRGFWGHAGALGKGWARDQVGELFEEVGIEGLTSLSNQWWTGVEADYSGLDDVAVSTLATGGMMSGGNVYSQVSQHYASKPQVELAQNALNKIEDLHDRLAAIPAGKKFDKQRAGIKERIKQQFATFGDINTEIEIAMMEGGAKKTKQLAANALDLRSLNAEAGVRPGMTEQQAQETRDEHVKSLKKSEADSYETRYADAKEVRDQLIEFDFENVSVEDLYGEQGVMMMEKLKGKKGFPKGKKAQLVKLHQALQKQARDNKLRQIKRVDKKRGGGLQQVVNQAVYGDPNYNGKRDVKKENLIWSDMAGNALAAQDKAQTLYDKQTKLSETFLTEEEVKNIKIVEAKDRKELERAILNDPNMTDAQRDKNLALFKQGKINGLISNGQYITLSKVDVNKALKTDGTLTLDDVINQGTVIMHEVSHAVDALAMTNEEQVDFAEKLESDISTRYEAVDQKAKERGYSEGWYNPDLSFAEQDANAKDEYTKAVQEIFEQEIFINDSIKLKKERQGLGNKVRGMFDGDFKFNTPQDATYYIADFINKFNEGKLSESAKRRIKQRKDSLVAFSPSSNTKVTSSQLANNATGVVSKKSSRSTAGSDLQGVMDSFKSRNNIEGDIVKGSNDSKKLAKELLQGGEIDLQKSILGEEAGGIIESITRRLYDNIPETELNGVTRQEYKNQLLTDLATMIEKEYSEVTINKKGVETRNSLDSFASNRLNARAGTVAQNMGIESSVDFGGLGFKVGIDKAANVIDNYQPTGVFGDEGPNSEEKKIISIRRKLNIRKGDPLYNKVLDTVVTATVAAGDINSDGFKKRLQDAFADAFVNDIKKLIGTPKSAKFKTFLQNDGPAVYSKMSLETLNQRFQHFTEAIVDEVTGKQKRKNVEKSDMDLKVKSKTAGNAEFKKKAATKQILEDWVNYFINPRSVTPGVGRADSRRTSLAEAISIELGFDAAMEVLEDPATMKMVKDLAELRGFEVSDNFLSVLGKTIDREPGSKFSSRRKQNIDSLQSFLRDPSNRILEGVDIVPVLDKYLESLSPIERQEMLPTINKVKELYKDQGKSITMEELRESIGKEAEMLGKQLGFEFFEGFDKMLEKITEGKVKRLDTSTTDGFEEYQRRTGEFSSFLDPDFLKLSMLGTTFTGAASLKTPRLRTNDEGVTKADGFKVTDVKPFYKPNSDRKGEFKGDLKKVKKIDTALEEKMLVEIKKMPENPTPAEIKALASKLNEMLPDSQRKAIEQARDYFYNKLNDYVNEDGISATERVARLAYVSTLLQTQSSASGGLARQGAVLGSVTLDYSKTQVRAKTGKPRPYQSEHNIQLLNFNGNVLKSIFNRNFATAYPIISKKYTQTLLDADAQSVLDSKTGELSEEFIKKYGERNLAEYIGKTSGAPNFIIGMDSEAMFVVALGNANRTLDLRTGLTMDQVIYNKINANKSLDYLDGLSADINEKMGESNYSSRVKQNKSVIFNDATNSSLWNNIITKSVLGVDPKSDVFMLSQRIEYKEDYLNVKRANNRVLLDYGLSNKSELKGLTEVEKIDKLKTLDKAVKLSRRSDVNPRGMSAFDFDETAGFSDNFVIATKDGETKRISSDQWPVVGDNLVKQGWKMDFSDFNKVTNGRPGPLMQKLKNQIAKYGNENVFILTARAAESAPAIKAYLESEGVNLPLKNITGLGNSTGEAKAMWMLDKFAEGYNDMYFVDDALPNVKAVKDVLGQLDIKSKVVQTKFSGRSTLDFEINQMIEDNRGIKNEARYSNAAARTRGKNIGNMQFFLPPSAEDFEGLIYPLLGKGKKGDAQKEWFNKHLFEPFARANRDINAAKQRIANEYRALKKQNKSARKKLSKRIPGSSFTYDQAARVYLWNKSGFDIPGLSKKDLDVLLAAVEANPDLKAFADQLGVISQQEKGYTEPSENWVVETVASDLNNITQRVGRKEYLAEWIQNKNEIFSKENLNKMESIFGSKWREAVEDILYRMENGTNKNFGAGSRIVNQYSNWVNNSVGAIMFFNGRSAVLQTLSTVNFINWSDNNPLKAAAAFANQPQFWKDFRYIFNSDMLKQRRSGLKTDVNQAELAQALAGQTNKAKAALNYLLKIGFTPTQIADSFAIASGGATFYRNRVNSLIKKGMDKKAAENQAWIDFQVIAEKTQQSSRPDMISQVQASPLGRLILAFQNTPMQYTRLIKRSTQDLINGRGDYKTNISKIVYYGAVQNFIFSALQSALFATIFGAEEDDEEALDKKKVRIGNSMIDSILRGSGLAGAALSTVKNIILTFMEQEKKGFMADHTYTILQAINLSPPIGSKARKLYSGIQTWRYNKDVIKSKGLSLDNPVWNGIGNVIDAGTNVPVGRVVQKMNNVKEALDSKNETWQRIALMLGWNTWDLDVENEDLNILREELKKQKKNKKKKKKSKLSGGKSSLSKL